MNAGVFIEITGTSFAMNIVYATDENGVIGVGVSIVSLMENLASSVHADIYILANGLTNHSITRLQSLEQKYDLQLHLIDVGDRFQDFPVGPNWSAATYYRLGLSSFLPSTVDRVLYVDIDVIFNRDAFAMYQTEMGDALIAGVFTTEHLSSDTFRRWEKEMELPHDSIYINAGVILYNLSKIREEHFEKHVLEYAVQHISSLTWQDQDIINKCYQERILLLHPMWNICEPAIWQIRWNGVKKFTNNPLQEEELLEAVKHPGIIHYWGVPKPWHPDSIRHDYGLFNKYWKISTFSDKIKEKKMNSNNFRMLSSYFKCTCGKAIRLMKRQHR